MPSFIYSTLFNTITKYNYMVHKMYYEIKGLLDNKSILLLFILLVWYWYLHVKHIIVWYVKYRREYVTQGAIDSRWWWRSLVATLGNCEWIFNSFVNWTVRLAFPILNTPTCIPISQLTFILMLNLGTVGLFSHYHFSFIARKRLTNPEINAFMS